MSDNNSSATAAPGGSMLGERRNQLALGGLLAVAVLGLAAYFLLFTGGDDDAGWVAPNARSAAAATAPAETPTAVATEPAVFKNDPRDPFAPVYAPLPPEPAASDETEAAAPGDVPAVLPGGPGSQPTGPAVGPEAPVAPTTETVSVRLVKVVGDSTVTVRVNGGSAQTVERGEVFGEVFALASTRLDEREATFQFGDGERFTLSAGETKRVAVVTQ